MALDQCPRRYDVEPIPIFDFRVGVGAAPGTVGVNRFRCPVPDPRVWVKFGVLWVPTVVSPPVGPSAATLTLWISAVERGGIAEQGTEFPVEDIIGTSAAPLTIPTNTALFGKFAQVKTAQTGLQAVMTVTTPTAGLEGTWFAKASYYPTVDMPREEWDRLVGAIGGIAPDAVVRLSV